MEYTEKMAEIIRQQLAQLQINEKEYDDSDESYKFTVVMTSETIDRYTEILKADGMEYENFMKNPVILADHRYLVGNIIGKAVKIYFDAENSRRICEGIFSKTNPLAKIARDLYNEGMLKAVSVGLIPKQRAENDRDIVVRWELLELSFVAVPANPDALSLDGKMLLKSRDEALKATHNDDSVSELVACVRDLTDQVSVLSQDIQSIKQCIVVDGKTADQDAKKIEVKELAQQASRLINEQLRLMKLM